ncbi:MAG: DUF3606 domain-containing protein [Xanthobacteraceae bacterium]
MALRRRKRSTKKRRGAKRRRSTARRSRRADRRLVSTQPHEVRRLARKFGVTGVVVKRTIRKVGHSRKKVEAALKKM